MDKNKNYTSKDFTDDYEISSNFDFSTSVPMPTILGYIISATGVSPISINIGGVPTVTNFPNANSEKESVKNNVIEALKYKENHSKNETLQWFYDKVRNGGEWDYKQLDKTERIELKKKYGIDVPSQYEDFGNYNYGAVAKAIGLSEELTKCAAGYANIVSRTGSPAVAALVMAKDRFDGGGISYGDDIKDQEMIEKGMNAVRPYIPENDPGMDDAVESMARKKLIQELNREIFDNDGLAEMGNGLSNLVKAIVIYNGINYLRDKIPEHESANSTAAVNTTDVSTGLEGAGVLMPVMSIPPGLLAAAATTLYGKEAVVQLLEALADASASSGPIVLTDQSKIPVLTDRSKFAPEGGGSGVAGLDPGAYMANLQQDLPGGDGIYAEAGAEWLGSIMAQAGTEGQEGAAPGDPGPAGAEAGGDARLDAAYVSWQAAEQARLERESSLAAIESVHALTAAIESRDGVSMVRELVNSINAVDLAAMHRGHGSLFGEHGDLAHAGLSAVGNGLGLAQALQAGDGWSTVSGTAALVRDIDSFVQANGGSFLGDRGSAALGALGRVLNFGAALEGGDGYAIAASGLNLASDIGNYIDSGGTTLTLGPDAGAGLTALSGVASGASLVLDIRNLSDAFESGDARDIAISGGHTAADRIVTCPVQWGILGSGAADDWYGILAA